jgi:hypothetical protein
VARVESFPQSSERTPQPCLDRRDWLAESLRDRTRLLVAEEAQEDDRARGFLEAQQFVDDGLMGAQLGDEVRGRRQGFGRGRGTLASNAA